MTHRIEESAYWARFEAAGDLIWRFDTRIYATPRAQLRRRDKPIGCIVGKNPGSALPAILTGALQPVPLRGDRFLPTVRAVVGKSFADSGSRWPDDGYVQVLNLFYLCDRDLTRALRTLRDLSDSPICPGERRRFPWSWFAWGGPDRRLDELKTRFLRRARRRAFFFCGDSQTAVNRMPGITDRARHTQGMPHASTVANLRRLVCRP